mmetsp:Transcript_46068/g.55445  ORF Transcript_46068/g.55445 Transcript_46068/m.55445 type:complete len:109 (+) Transcript_46068:258-584(+)
MGNNNIQYGETVLVFWGYTQEGTTIPPGFEIHSHSWGVFQCLGRGAAGGCDWTPKRTNLTLSEKMTCYYKHKLPSVLSHLTAEESEEPSGGWQFQGRKKMKALTTRKG